MRRRELQIAVMVVLASVMLFYAHPAWGTSSLLIRVQNSQTVLSLFPSQTAVYTVVVHNGVAKVLIASFRATVISTPPGALATDIHLVYPSSLSLSPGNTMVKVKETVAGDAHPGTYVIANTVTVA